MKIIKLLFLFVVLSIFSQNKKIDSLELVLKTHAKKDTVYVNLLNQIAVEAYPNDNDKVLSLVEKVIFLSDSLSYIKGKSEAHYLCGKVETIQLNLDDAEKNIIVAMHGFKIARDNLGVAKCLTLLGVVYYYRVDNDKALEYYYKSLEVNEGINNDKILANTYINIGLIYSNKKEYNKALKFYYKSLVIDRKLNNTKYIAIALNNIGIVYEEQNNFIKALKVYEECLKISKKNNDKYLIGSVSHNLALLNLENKNYKKSLSLFKTALKTHEEINDKSGICYVNNGISRLYIELKQYDKALKHLKISKEIAEKYKLHRHKMDIDEILSVLYEEQKKYKKSLEFYKKYKVDYDSINSIESKNKIIELEKKYEFKKKELLAKEKEILLNEKIDLTNKKYDQTKKQILYGLIVVLFLFVILGFVAYNSRLKRLSSEYQKVVLKQKLLRSQMKPHFIFNSLSVLQGIVLHKEYKKASSYISKFSRLLREILETSREEIINLEKEIRIIENYIFLRSISGYYSQCKYNITIDKKIDIKNTFIPPMIVQPIVENSFEHGFIELDKKYELSIDFKIENNNLICTIIDNGEGLDDDDNKKYFNKKKSISSSIIKERLELFSKKLRKEYSYKVIDRTLNGKKGTEVILVLPFKIENND